MLNVWTLLAIGFAFHLVYLVSIFDIYFISPLVLDLSPIEYVHLIPQPPADRLVLIVGDGLRADRLFEDPSRAPFLNEIIQTQGAYGVSHTRVPTGKLAVLLHSNL